MWLNRRRGRHVSGRYTNEQLVAQRPADAVAMKPDHVTYAKCSAIY
jgi:hypothetical protein